MADLEERINNISKEAELVEVSDRSFLASFSDRVETLYKDLKHAYRDLGVVIKNVSIAGKMFGDEEYIVSNYEGSLDNYDKSNFKINTENESWYYINGIATTESEALLQEEVLEKMFHKEITTIYNPTKGFFSDLMESIKERTFNRKTEITENTKELIKKDLLDGKKVVIIGHSQGGIIASGVVNLLIKDKDVKDKLKNLELYTFASAADKVSHHKGESLRQGRLVPYSEHYVNEKDFVAQIGVGATIFRSQISGDIYSADAAGHFLVEHYLEHFKNGVYTKDSRLFNYLENSDNELILEAKKKQMLNSNQNSAIKKGGYRKI